MQWGVDGAGLTPPVPPADVLLADGRVARIRPLEAGDRERLVALHATASLESLRMRFFTVGRRTGDQYVERLYDQPESVLAALVAEAGEDLLALGAAHRLSDDEAEVALFVADAAHGRGLGTLLLEHLAAVARRCDVTTLHAEVLAENTAMLRVIKDAGFTARRRVEDDVVLLELSTSLTRTAVAASDQRDCAAEARSLQPLLYPSTVAVVGVRRDRTGVGNAVVRGIRACGYRGELFVVHPAAAELDGVAVYPRLSAVPARLDLVVATVPADRVHEVVADACRADASCVVVISSGFRELGPDGAAAEAALVRLARAHSVRLVGPNCLGVMSNDPSVRLNATLAPSLPPSGGLAVASQSGGVGITLLETAGRTGLGISGFVSLGNKADVSGNDLLAAWLDDPRVTAAALYLESLGNVRRFARLARTFAERKPLLVVVGGRSSGGRRAGASHTAAAAVPSAGLRALVAQTGVIECRTGRELTDTARLLAEQPLARGPRVGLVSNAGGIGVMAADAAEALGLAVPELGPGLRHRIARRAAGAAGVRNPVDLGAAVAPDELRACVGELLASEEVDAVVVALVSTIAGDLPGLLQVVREMAAAGQGLPLLLVILGDGAVGPPAGATSFETVEDALSALAHQVRYAAWLRSRHEPVDADDAADAVDDDAPNAARAVARGLLAGPPVDQWLSLPDIRRLLSPYGLRPLGEVADGAAAAVRVADRLGYPVAVKVADPAIVHKTERGLVRVGVGSPAEVRQAADHFARELGADGVAVIVQPMLPGRVEVALGIVRDSAFGPLVMVAAGGTALDVWDDRAFLMPPFDHVDARRAVRSLRIWPLLDGYRGSPPVDVAGLERALVRLGRLAAEVPEVAELDLNPVMASASGIAIVDAKVRLAPALAVQTGIPRQLSTAL